MLSPERSFGKYSIAVSLVGYLSAESGPNSFIYNKLLTCHLVITACVAMAYPPRQQRPPNENDIFDETGAALPEVIPNPGPHVHHHDIVHFDIDPRNVFVYDTDANHRTMPVFKVRS